MPDKNDRGINLDGLKQIQNPRHGEAFTESLNSTALYPLDLDRPTNLHPTSYRYERLGVNDAGQKVAIFSIGREHADGHHTTYQSRMTADKLNRTITSNQGVVADMKRQNPLYEPPAILREIMDAQTYGLRQMSAPSPGPKGP